MTPVLMKLFSTALFMMIEVVLFSGVYSRQVD